MKQTQHRRGIMQIKPLEDKHPDAHKNLEMFLASSPSPEEIVQLTLDCLDHSEKVNQLASHLSPHQLDSSHLLTEAATGGLVNTLKVLLTYPHSADTVIEAIEAAALVGDAEIIDILVTRVNKNIWKEKNRFNGLASAAGRGHLAATKSLLNITFSPHQGAEAIAAACISHYPKIVEVLAPHFGVRPAFNKVIGQWDSAHYLLSYFTPKELKDVQRDFPEAIPMMLQARAAFEKGNLSATMEVPPVLPQSRQRM